MAGHSKFKNIMHRKGNQDKKRAQTFTKLVREIHVAAKGGPIDPNFNPRLRAAILAARTANMIKDKIENAIYKATSSHDSSNYEEVRYEGYASGGIAIIIEALTDNRNRTASDVRSAFTKFGGALAETGSVSFMFNRLGVITYQAQNNSFDAFFDHAINSGANDCIKYDDVYEITCNINSYHQVLHEFEQKFGQPQSTNLEWRAHDYIAVDEIVGQNLIRLTDALEESDDVQSVVGNFELPKSLEEDE